MPCPVEFFFDLSSPWTRLAFHNIQPIVAETGARIVWRPFLVGGVFNAVNAAFLRDREDAGDRRQTNVPAWLQEWAALSGVLMHFPSRHHPVRSVAAMRFCCALEPDQDALFRFASAAFDAYFTHERNLDDIAVLIDVADDCGLSGLQLAERAGSDTVKQALREATDEAIERGAFGSPTIFVDARHMYFGNDQLPLVRRRIALWGGQV